MATERPGDGEARESRQRVPALLVTTADWAWRLILVGALVYLLMRIFEQISIVAIPCALALLLTALLHPLVERLRRAGMPSLAATWVAILLALTLLVGVGVLVGVRANAEFPRLITELKHTTSSVQDWLINGPLHMKKSQLEQEVNKGLKYVQDRQSQLANTALSATLSVVEFLAGLVLMLFVTFFLLKDGRQIWAWLIAGTGQYRGRVERAGAAGWQTLSHYVQGTVMVSAVHAIAVAITLTIIGVPLVAPLAVLVFFSSFIPLVGILFAGGVALLVVFSAKGLVAGLIFLGVLIVEQQLEGHLLQPLVVGRRLHFHPLAIIVVLSIGGVVGGIPGAALSVPLTAIIYRAWPELRRPAEAEVVAEMEIDIEMGVTVVESLPEPDGERPVTAAPPGEQTDGKAAPEDAPPDNAAAEDAPPEDASADNVAAENVAAENVAAQGAVAEDTVAQDAVAEESGQSESESGKVC